MIPGNRTLSAALVFLDASEKKKGCVEENREKIRMTTPKEFRNKKLLECEHDLLLQFTKTSPTCNLQGALFPPYCAGACAHENVSIFVKMSTTRPTPHQIQSIRDKLLYPLLDFTIEKTSNVHNKLMKTSITFCYSNDVGVLKYCSLKKNKNASHCHTGLLFKDACDTVRSGWLTSIFRLISCDKKRDQPRAFHNFKKKDLHFRKKIRTII